MARRRVVIKIGGRAFAGEDGFRQLAQGIRNHPEIEVLIVHGGGAEISHALKAAGRPTQFVDGIRVTRSDDIRIVDRVLSESVNSRIAGWLEKSGVASCRLAGKTGQLLVVTPLIKGGRDFGFVGEVQRVNPGVVLDALNAGQVPVISPISVDARGALFNVNADSAAAALAAALGCTDLIFITDVPGIQAEGRICEHLEIGQAIELIAKGAIQGGMIAKIKAGIRALESGVSRVHITAWAGEQGLDRIVSKPGRGGTVLVC